MQKYDQHGSDVLRYKPVVVVQDLLDVGLAHAPDTDTLTWLCGLMAGVFIIYILFRYGKCWEVPCAPGEGEARLSEWWLHSGATPR